MRLKEKLLIVVLVALIFVVAGAIACTYYTTYAIDPILAVLLGILVFVLVGVMVCSYSRSRIAKPTSK